MNTQSVQGNWTEKQESFIRFLAAKKKDTKGQKWTEDKFAKEVLDVDPATLWRWKQLPGFAAAVFEEKLRRNIDFLPDMVDAQTIKAIKQRDTNAFKEMLRAMELLKADKQESKADIHHEVKYSFDAQSNS